MIAEHSVRLVSGPKHDLVRPTADAMLRAAAKVYGDRAIGVVLSGHGSDGTIGSLVLSDAGGVVLAQDPLGSQAPSMPSAAIDRGGAESLPVADLAPALLRLVGTRGAPGTRAPRRKREIGSPTTVLLADDHRIMLDGLRALLAAEPDIEVVGEAEDGEAAVLLARRVKPDVVVMDVGMPHLDGIEATRCIRAQNPDTRVVILSARTDPAAARRVLEAGATGYVCKEAAFSEVAIAVRAVARGTSFWSPRIANIIARSAR
jgi:chemotaxis response regulator CheB